MERASKAHREGQNFVLVTVVETFGSAPTETGSRMLVLANETIGTVGGGAIEKNAIEKSREILACEGAAELIKKTLSDLQMECGGEMVLFFEPFFAALPLWIFGGGHVAKALVPIAASLGFNTTVVDNRPEFADIARFPAASKVVCSSYTESARNVPSKGFAVIITHGHSHDEEVLKELVQLNPALTYIGMIGSKKKIPAILAKLRSQGFEIGSNLYAPIGLDLGGGSPAEIAVSIAAELMSLKNSKIDIKHCRERIKTQSSF